MTGHTGNNIGAEGARQIASLFRAPIKEPKKNTTVRRMATASSLNASNEPPNPLKGILHTLSLSRECSLTLVRRLGAHCNGFHNMQ